MRYNDDDKVSTYKGDPSVDATTARVRMALAESNYRNSKPRQKVGDTSRVNKVYGPIAASANIREGRSPDRSPRPDRPNAREDRATKPKSNFTYNAPKADKAKPNPNRANVRENRVASKPKAKTSKTVAGFKKGSVGEKAISSFKKAYQGK